MSGECDKGREHCLDCACKEHKEYHDYLTVMEKNYLLFKELTTCFNLTERILRLFTLQNEKEEVNKLIDKFHIEMKKKISKMYD